MDKELSEFILKGEVIPIHIKRYDAQINRLLSIQDYSENDVFSGAVGYREFLKARERKIKALNDCLTTMIAKESLLQFHNLGTEFSFTDENVEIRKPQPKYNLESLTYDEQVELYHLWMKAKIDQRHIVPITGIDETQAEEFIEDAVVIEETPNISQIKKIEASPNSEFILKPVDPLTQIKKSFDKLAVQKFAEVGTITSEEENLLK